MKLQIWVRHRSGYMSFWLCISWHFSNPFKPFQTSDRSCRFVWSLLNNSSRQVINVSCVMEFLSWWVLKSKVFAQKSTVVNLNCCILWIDIEWGLQKLGLILESKVVQKLSLEKNVLNKKWSPKLIFLDEIFFLKKFGWFLT